MPAAFENYSVYSREMQRVHSISPLTPGEQENFFTYQYDSRIMSTAGAYSPSSMESPQMDTYDEQVFEISGNTPIDIDTPITISNIPTEIKIVVQPVDKFRFRYKSEMMGTHGSLLGEREESSHKKEVPTVQLLNCPFKNAVIRCTLVTADEDRRFPHAHHLVRKDGNTDKDDPHDIEVSDENNYTAMFCNMGIIHTAKKNIKDEIMRKRKLELLEEKKRLNPENTSISTREALEMKMEAEKAQKWMNLNSVALCFQGFFYDGNNILHPVTDKIYSRPINNLKSALTGELKICRIDKITSSCEGGEDVWLLVEKVGKKNIKVKFFETDERDNVIWEADGRFSELDVHHQYAIVFKTPPYKDIHITEPKEVFLKLERPSDGEVSNSVNFKYKPTDKALNRKRPRMSSSGSLEFAQNAFLHTPRLENCIAMSETCMNIGDEFGNISQEIEKLINERNDCTSEDMKKYFNLSNIENYLILTNPSDHELATDGGEIECIKSQEDFARDIVRKITTICKEAESSSSKEEIITKIRTLLEETTNFGDTPLHFSLRHEQYEIAKYILFILGSDQSFKNIVDLQNSCGKTPLHLAVLQNQSEFVRALLRLGANPNLCDEEDATSLHNAVIVNANECLEELLKSNMKLNLEAHTESGWSALHLAAKVGSLNSVKALVEAGANVNATDMSYGRTALHIAVDSNHKHIVNYLLKKTKIDVNLKNFGGNTALHSAVAKGGKCAEELIKILKNHGADPNIRNNNINRDDQDEEESNTPSLHLTLDSPTLSTIKSESSDTEEDESTPGESSFDLARDDPKLMQLLSEERPIQPMEEELDLKEESEDDMTLEERVIMQAQSSMRNHINNQTCFTPLTQSQPASEFSTPIGQKSPPAPKFTTLISKSSTPSSKSSTPASKPSIPAPTSLINTFTPEQLEMIRQGDEKLTDEHVKHIADILDKTKDNGQYIWEKLAQKTNHGSLVRLYRKTSSPSTALFGKIRLQQPDITVRQVKKLLIEVQAFEAAATLEKR